MGTGGYEDRTKSYRRKRQKGISKIYVISLKFVLFVLNVLSQNVIVYHEAKGIQPTVPFQSVARGYSLAAGSSGSGSDPGLDAPPIWILSSVGRAGGC